MAMIRMWRCGKNWNDYDDFNHHYWFHYLLFLLACLILYQYHVDSCFGNLRLSRFNVNPLNHWGLRDYVPIGCVAIFGVCVKLGVCILHHRVRSVTDLDWFISLSESRTPPNPNSPAWNFIIAILFVDGHELRVPPQFWTNTTWMLSQTINLDEQSKVRYPNECCNESGADHPCKTQCVSKKRWTAFQAENSWWISGWEIRWADAYGDIWWQSSMWTPQFLEHSWYTLIM